MGIKSGQVRQIKNPNPPVPATFPVRPFGMPTPPYDAVEGRYLKLKADESTVPIEVVRATVVSEDDDYLICRFVASGQEIKVAKPYTLRRTPYDGETLGAVEVTYVYSAANVRVASKEGEDDETQYITPDYEAGEEIVILRHDTGVVAPDGEGAIFWEDLNTAGRAWATE